MSHPPNQRDFDRDDDEQEPVCCPACGDEKPRFMGKKNRSGKFVCTREDCQLLWESLRPGAPPRDRRVRR
jgi:hypothetical protein